MRLNKNGSIKYNLIKRGFGLFSMFWKTNDNRQKSRSRVEEFINILDKDITAMDANEKSTYLNDLYYDINGMLTGIRLALGYNSEHAHYPKEFEKISRYVNENYMQIFDHFRKQYTNRDYDKRNEIKDPITGKKLPYYTYSSHPYTSIDAEQLIELNDVLKTIGWSFRIKAYSDHFPSHTIHIQYYKLK